jgi:hypothetical protein
MAVILANGFHISKWLSYQQMAVISVSHALYDIFVFKTADHDKEGTILLQISANSLATNGCSADFCN